MGMFLKQPSVTIEQCDSRVTAIRPSLPRELVCRGCGQPPASRRLQATLPLGSPGSAASADHSWATGCPGSSGGLLSPQPLRTALKGTGLASLYSQRALQAAGEKERDRGREASRAEAGSARATASSVPLRINPVAFPRENTANSHVAMKSGDRPAPSRSVRPPGPLWSSHKRQYCGQAHVLGFSAGPQ